MLNIYYGSDYIDKEKFMFENIKGRTLLIVPDQFSLQAESDAFFYLGEKGIMDLRIVDFSTLGHKAVSQVGGPVLPLIDKYGRHMLLAGIINDLSDELTVYRHMRWKNSFTELVNSIISEMKRFEVGPHELGEAAEKLEGSGFLKYKLRDIEKIFSEYQKAIEGKYLDSEDYITFYGNKLLQAKMVAESDIWIYGFDTFTPKNFLVIERLLKAAKSVNVVMTYEDKEMFSLINHVIGNLKDTADGLNEETSIKRIETDKRYTVWDRAAAFESGQVGEFPVTVYRAHGIYEEMEEAASYILHLVRDKGYKYGDIVVVCNDIDERGGILKRLLLRWGIPVFVDKKRKVMHHAAVGFLLTLLELAAFGYNNETVIRLIKSGLTGISGEDGELLENYAIQYKIKGNMWKKPFTKGEESYTGEELEKIDAARNIAIGIAEEAKKSMGKRNTAADKIRGLYGFLENDLKLRERLEAIMGRQTEKGLNEAAAETAQSWNVICNILNQIVETVGERKLSDRELLTLISAGLEEIEIGLVPTTSDCVLIGTLQRTRLSRIKALVVVGANEGIIPMGIENDGLLSEREKAALESLELEFSKRESVARQEEELAVYRMLSIPEERIYISCSMADGAGEALRPADVFYKVKSHIPKRMCRQECAKVSQREHSRIHEQGIQPSATEATETGIEITTKEGCLGRMAEAIGRFCMGYDIDEDWLHVMNWFDEKEPDMIRNVREGLKFSNSLNDIGERFADELYRGDKENIMVSASQLERYSGCPFSYFISYGLRPEELRAYEIGAREIGDIYHECLMRFSKKLTSCIATGDAVTGKDSPWMSITRDECHSEIEKILKEELNEYREGLLTAGKAEEYKVERITEICDMIAWTLVEQVRKGQIEKMFFETPFGKGCNIPAININIGKRDVLIRGKIDRLDIIGGQEPAVRVIDYKTGSDTIDIEQIRNGYKLQLMIYMKAGLQMKYDGDTEALRQDDVMIADVTPIGNATAALPDSRLKPAGIFYFKIKELDTNADVKKIEGGEDAFNKRAEDAYRLEGVVLNDRQIIEAMDGEFDDSSKVVPVKKSRKDGAYAAASGGSLISEDEFKELYEQVNSHVERICRDICSGVISIEPKREKKKDMEGNYKTACKYCRYKGICMFDTSIDGCRYSSV